MKIRVNFKETKTKFPVNFGEVHNISDGGYEKGYAAGYEKGYDEGLAARKHEVWTITLADGTVVEKEVALL